MDVIEFSLGALPNLVGDNDMNNQSIAQMLLSMFGTANVPCAPPLTPSEPWLKRATTRKNRPRGVQS